MNYCDTTGHTIEAILLDGVVAGLVSLINAATFGATGLELIDAFVSGFLQGAVCSATSGFGFGNLVKYAIILYDVGSAVYQCWEAGASWEECTLVALAQLWAALSFVQVETDHLFDLVFGVGTTLCATGITEGVLRRNSTNEDSLSIPCQESNAKQSSGVPNSIGSSGGRYVFVCCKAY